MNDILIIKSHIDFRKAMAELFFAGSQTTIKYHLYKPLPNKTIHRIVEWKTMDNPDVNQSINPSSCKYFNLSKNQYIKIYDYSDSEIKTKYTSSLFIEIKTNVCEIDVYLKTWLGGGYRINYDLLEDHIAKTMKLLGYDLEFVLDSTE